jgi:glycosyltransferase involved in cell wall biosynthesis
MRKIRVLMVGQFAAGRERIDGGVSAVISYLSGALASRDDVEIIGARTGASSTSPVQDDVLGFPVHNIVSGRFGLLTRFRAQRRRFWEILRQVRPDVVHGQGADLAGFLACRSGKPAVVTIHGIIREDAKFKSRVTDRVRETLSSWIIESTVIREAKSLILISPYVAQYYGDTLRGHVHNIPNPVSQEYFDIDPAPERGRILFAGRVIPRKGVIDLVSAFARLDPRIQGELVIAGSLADARYVAQVRRLICDFGIVGKVRLLGLLSEAQVISEFARAQVLVLPSYQETAPMVILQAMAAGIPVVATRICGVPYLLRENVSGFSYSPGDVPSLIAHLGTVLANSDLARRMGDAGRAIAQERFHANAVAEATVRVYRSLAAAGS